MIEASAHKKHKRACPPIQSCEDALRRHYLEKTFNPMVREIETK